MEKVQLKSAVVRKRIVVDDNVDAATSLAVVLRALGHEVFVALSGFGLPEDRARALQAGFDQHMVKPADPAFLKSLLG